MAELRGGREMFPGADESGTCHSDGAAARAANGRGAEMRAFLSYDKSLFKPRERKKVCYKN